MTSKSKSKGNNFERDIRDLLNEVYQTKEFARTPSSGAIMGLGNYQKNSQLEDATKKTLGSDIICPSWFNFSIECKNYGDKPNYNKLISSNDAFLDGWIGEALFDAVNAKRTPLLFFRTSRKGTFCVLPKEFLLLISKQNQNYLVYQSEFIILDVDFFSKYAKIINEWNTLYNDIIQQWLNDSEIVKKYIDNMLSKKGKK